MAYNNPNLVFRIKFVADASGTIGIPSGSSGNNRFDNVAIEGDTTTVTPLTDHTGIFETANSQIDLVMYPNPATSELFINSTSIDTKHILIMNITGQIVAEYTDNAKQVRLDISELKQGLYFIQVRENNTVSTKKLMKK